MSPIAVPSTASTAPTTKTTSTTSTTAQNPKPFPSPYHSSSTASAIALESQHAAQNYHPLPIVFARALGTTVWDPEGRSYLDFLSAYSAVNQGHCHPALVEALTAQASRLTLSSRAFYNDVFPQFASFVTDFFGFDRVLPMNTGAEAVETAVKVARAWGGKHRGVREGVVLGVEGNFHGRTYSAISLSADPSSRDGFGPFVPGVTCEDPRTGRAIPYDDVDALRAAVRAYQGKVVAVVLEPVQGEAGIVVPKKGYLEGVAQVCKEENCLLVLDEIQTGIARTGKLLCHEWAHAVKPDMLLLGKAISGGMYPVSCVLGREEVMLSVDPGSHGSTYGGNPLGCAVAIKALEVVRDEGLVERAEQLGKTFRDGLEEIRAQGKAIKEVRGMGLLNAIVIDEKKAGGSAWDLCLVMKEKGMLAKPTHGDIIRLAPPLVITEEELEKALGIIKEALAELASKEEKNGFNHNGTDGLEGEN